MKTVTKISASKLARVIHCQGSLKFDNLPEQEENEAANEGTAFSELVERKILGQQIGEYASNGVLFDEEMFYFAEGILSELKKEFPNSTIKTEQWATWGTAAGILIPARYDISSWKDGDLYIKDIKYGYGLVEAVENWQLISYAIGEIINVGEAPKNIHLSILQPRGYHHLGPVRTWTISYQELLKYKHQIEELCANIVAGLDLLVTGDHCKYCPAAAHCPSMNQFIGYAYDFINEFLQDDLSNLELSRQLDLVTKIEDMVKTRKGSLELLAKTRISSGQDVINYTVKPSYGHRTWNNGLSNDAVKMLTGIDITETKLITPAAAERRGLSKDFVEKFTTKPTLNPSLKRIKGNLGNQIFGKTEPKKEN